MTWQLKYKRQKKWYYKHKKKRGFIFLNKTLLEEIKFLLSKNYRNQRKNETEEYIKKRWEFFNPEKAKLRKKKWYIKNGKEYRKKRYSQDPRFRLRIGISNNISHRLKRRLSDKKGKSTFEFLPYTLEKLRIHLENHFREGMSWENYGKWHIDHIKPDSKFHYKNVGDKAFKKCWALENLQPMWAKDNWEKSDKVLDKV